MPQAGSFGAQRVISAQANGAMSVYAIDLDGDGDMDVLSASTIDDKIAWHENQGGGVFGAQQVISTLADNPRSVHATDLDGDGDADVLSAALYDDEIAWYENQGGGVFGTQQVITTETDGARSVHAIDLDGDGDADVLSASYGDNKVAWYENQGGGVFGAQQVISTQADEPRSVHAADLDGDGDADLLSASYADDTIALYENLMGPFDCNGNGIPDPDDIANGTSQDCNGNGIPDSCEPATLDCDSNGLIDSCEIALDPQLDRNQDTILDACQYAISSYCPSLPNTSGNSATLSGTGLPSVVLNELTLQVQGAGVQKFGLFFNGVAPQSIFAGEGVLCVSGPKRIYPLLVTDATGATSLSLDLTGAPFEGSVQAGDTRYFQFWFRDPLGGPAGFNFSDGLEVEFCQ